MRKFQHVAALFTVLLLSGCAAIEQRSASSGPESIPTGRTPEAGVPVVGIDGRVHYQARGVASQTLDPFAFFDNATPEVRITSFEVPKPKSARPLPPMPYDAQASGASTLPTPPASAQKIVGTISPVFDAVTFDNDAALSGFYHIPPDSHAAAGPNHIVVVTNTSVRTYNKSGVQQSATSLRNFFSPVGFATPPTTGTFDPKVLYDPFAQRWLLVTLERTTSPQASYIFLAVSATNDPTGSWTVTRIDSLETISGNVSWLDYPGFAYDEEAIYITGNMFAFTGAFQGVRLFVLPKGLGTGGFYDGGGATASRYNPFAGGGIATTAQPARIIGAPPGGTLGTWLVSYSSLSDGTNEFVQAVSVSNPLGVPTFTVNQRSMGNISNNGALPDAPQSGTANTVETNDTRALDAVWQNAVLWTAFTFAPNSGTNSGQPSARYVRMAAASTSVTFSDAGEIGAEDVASGAFAFFPAISVNERGAAVIGFSASDDSIFPGAYAVSRRATDAVGVVSVAQTLRAGTDHYRRTFGGAENRWGDYSGVATDPSDQCFWIFNQYAMTRGTILSGEDGRWATTVGRACVCQGTQTADTDLDGICDGSDNCPATANFGQQNADGDSLGDACDPCPGDAAGGCAAPSADLSIAKTNGVIGLTAGATTLYTITVSNPSANAVSGVTVTDSFPSTLAGCTWTCAASGSGSCPASFGSGNISQTLVVAAGGTVTFSATCRVRSTATGSVVNVATVSYANDPATGNNSATDTDGLGPTADLSISKTDGFASINAGANTTYSIVVTNPATSAVSDVAVADNFPATLTCTWTCAASSGGACQSASGSGSFATTTNSIAANNGTLTFTAACALNATATGSLVNTATVAYANDGNAANNSATDTNSIVPRADLAISKTDGIATINAGANTTYTITVANPVAVAVSNVSVSDTFAPTLACTWTCAASSGGACQSASGSGNIATTTNSIAANNGTLTFTAACTLDATATGSLLNTATVAYGNDNNSANDSATDTNTVVPRADLAISKTDGIAAINAGANTTYTITISNPATVAVSNVSVSDTFAPALTCTWNCAASSGGACQSGSGSGNIATTTNTIAGNNGTLTFTAACALGATATGSLVNIATVAYANDNNTANDSATDTNSIVPRADLAISKSDGASSVNAGGNMIYTIVATNPAAVTVSNVSVNDSFPATLSSCTWTCTASAGGSCQSASGNGNISTTTNSIAGNNGSLNFAASCTLDAGATGVLSNTASVSYSNDPTAANNAATDTSGIVPRADLAIAKTDNATTVNAGANNTYTIIVTNPATTVVSDVGVSDIFPASLSSCSWTCAASSGGACQSPAGSGNIVTTTNSIAANNGTLTLNATCLLSQSASGTLSNTATLSYGNDPNSANNSATDTSTIAPRADVRITKTDGLTSVNAGASTTYTIVVSNPGSDLLNNVAVTDIIPAGLTCSWNCTATLNGTCQTASGTGNISTTSNVLGSGGNAELQFTLNCSVDAAATGTISNTATVSYGNDSNSANNTATDSNSIVPRADLAIAKTDGATSVSAGANNTYTIAVTNPATTVVSNVGVNDIFPVTLSSCTWTCSASGGGACQSASGSGNIATTTNSIGSNGTLTFAATCTIGANATGTLANTASVAYANDNNSTNNTATDNSSIVPQANIAITKTDGLTTVNAGASLTYAVVVTNPASVAIANVAVSDTFPASLTACTWTCTASSGGACQNASGSGNITTTSNSIAGNNGTLTFNASCTLSATAVGTLTNTASAGYANDPDPGDNSATDTSAIRPRADVAIAVTNGVNVVNAGSPVSYTITASNPSANAIDGVGVDALSGADVSACAWTCTASSGGSCASTNGSGSIATVGNTLAAGGTITFGLNCTVNAAASGTLVQAASVNYGNDINASNNSATDSDPINAQAALSITKSNAGSSVNAGDASTYTINVSKTDGAAVANVGVSDVFPAALTGCTWTCSASGGACAQASGSGNIVTTSNSLGVGSASLTFSATCTVDAGASGSLSNSASVSYVNDTTPGDNTATDTDTIAARSDLSITKTNGVNGVSPGGTTSYSIVISNPGAAVGNVVVNDNFAAPLTACTWTCAASVGGACQAAGGSGNIAQTTNSIAAGGTLTLTAGCAIAANATGSVSNTATVAYGNDPTASNDSATDVDVVLGDGVFANGFE